MKKTKDGLVGRGVLLLEGTEVLEGQHVESRRAVDVHLVDVLRHHLLVLAPNVWSAIAMPDCTTWLIGSSGTKKRPIIDYFFVCDTHTLLHLGSS